MRRSTRNRLIVGSTFLAMLSLGLTLMSVNHGSYRRESRHASEALAMAKSHSVTQVITRAISATYAIESMLGFDEAGTLERFEPLATDLVNSVDGLDAIALAPGGVHTHVAPHRGYETVIGFDLFDDPIRRPEAERAIEARAPTLGGPLPVAGGGTGFFGRVPVFIEGEFWGFIIAVIRTDTLIEAAGLDDLLWDHRFALRKLAPVAEAQPFLTSPAGRASEVVPARIEVPGGTWELEVGPSGGWGSPATSPVDGLLVVLFAMAVAFGTYRMLRHPTLLQEKIDERTQELQTSLVEAWLQKRQLQAAQDHVRGILRSTPDAVVAGTGSGIVTEWNDAAERLYGWSRQEALGRHLGFLLPAGAVPIYEEHAEALGDGQKIRTVATRSRKDGSTFLAELTLSGFRDDRGYLRSWVAVVRDVTEEQIVREVSAAMASSLEPVDALEALLRPLDEALGTTTLGLAAIDGGQMRRLATVTADGLRLPGDTTPISLAGSAAGRAVGEGGPVVVRDVGADPSLGPAKVGWFVVLPMCQHNGPFATLTAGFDELTPPSRKKLELLTQVARTIAQDVANILLYERERETSRRLTELDELKSDFLSTVSHELRTPLTAICGFAATLDERWTDLEEGTRQDFVRRVLRKADRLDELIRELLDFARLENGGLQVSVEPCGLLSQLHREASREDHIRKTHDVVVTGDPSVVALADPQALSRVMTNLLTNATKFSDPGTRITIGVERTQGEAVVSVSDEGIGVPVGEQERIFERFYRVERGDRVVAPGTGIGLAIVQQFVQAQGGRVWLESEPGRGTTFFFTLRLAPESMDPPLRIDSGDGLGDYTRLSRPAQ